MPESINKSRRYWPRRYTVVGLCFCSTFVCYIDRVNISVAIIPMAAQFGWNEVDKGLILSSFFLGYMLTQVMGGWLGNRFGGKLVLGFGVLWWSIFTILTPLAAIASVPLLLAARVAMGMGEGVAFPAIYSLFSRWVPADEKARAVTFNLSGLAVGTITAISVTPWIATTLGWPVVFYLFGSVGFVWLYFWWRLVTSTPAKHPTISTAELEHIESSAETSEQAPEIPWRKLLTCAPVWAIIINHFCNNWGFYVLLTWLPSYFAGELGIELGTVWIYVAPPWITLFVMTNVSGWIGDSLFKYGLSTTAVRKFMQTVGMLGPALFLLFVSRADSAPQAVALLCCTLGLVSFAFAGFAPNHLDIAPRYAVILFGFSNTAGTLPGIIGVALTGWLIAVTGSYEAAFQVAAGVYVLGAVVWLQFATGERVFE